MSKLRENPGIERQIYKFLNELNLIYKDSYPEITEIKGGVSSELWKVSFKSQNYCIKRSLKRLRVEEDWEAPIVRNLNEFNYLNSLESIVPQNIPKPIAYSHEYNMFIMQYFDEKEFKNWKLQLKAGIANYAVVKKLADIVGTIHQFTYKNRHSIMNKFQNEDIFYHTRIKPYFLSLIDKYSNLREYILQSIDLMQKNKHVLVHGDISPKNILVSNKKVILLDAECAWHGDPAFDIAFLLNHMLLKCLFNSNLNKYFLDSYELILNKYIKYVIWEEIENFTKRLSNIIPILILARIDGRAPVEYIQNNALKNKIRNMAINIMHSEIKNPLELKNLWEEFLIKEYNNKKYT